MGKGMLSFFSYFSVSYLFLNFYKEVTIFDIFTNTNKLLIYESHACSGLNFTL